MDEKFNPKRHGLPMNIQFFAESNDDNPPDNQPSNSDPDGDDNDTPTIEDLMAELAKEKAEKAKLKNAFDKTASEASEAKKKLREKMTAEEEEAEAKREEAEAQKAYVKKLEDEVNLSKKTKNYMSLGMSEELAAETAKLDLEGDEDAVRSNIKKNQELLIKAAEKEWLNSRPDPAIGNNDDEKKDDFISGFKSVFTGLK